MGGAPPPFWVNAVNTIRTQAQQLDQQYNVSGRLNTAQNSVRQAVAAALNMVDRFRARQAPIFSEEERTFLKRVALMQIRIDGRPVVSFLDRLIRQINRERNWNNKLAMAMQGFNQVFQGLDQHMNAHRQLSLTEILQIDQHNNQALMQQQFDQIISFPSYMQARNYQVWSIQNESTATSHLRRWTERLPYRNMNQAEFMNTVSLFRQLVFRMGQRVQDIQGRINTGNTP